MNGGSDAVEVVGGEKVEERGSQHSKCQAALGGSSGGRCSPAASHPHVVRLPPEIRRADIPMRGRGHQLH